MKIKIKKSAIVKPALETPRCRIWCSNLDLVMPSIHTPTVYFYKSQIDGSNPHAFSFEHLKDSLSRALVAFYPIAGWLRLTESGRIDINCNGEGVLLVEAMADDCMSYYGEHFSPNPKMMDLIPKLDYPQPMSNGHPILILQVTWFKCGGVSLGVGIQHTVADGPSSLMFLNFWGDVSRGIAHSDSTNPFFDRTILRARDPLTPKFEHVEYQEPPPLTAHTIDSNVKTTGVVHDTDTNHNGDTINDKTSYVTEVFYFTKGQVNDLKKKAAQSILSNSKLESSIGVGFTSYEVIAAHIWRCVSIARELQDTQLSKLYISIDGRSRLRPRVPDGYFGNVIFRTTPMKPVRELVNSSLGSISKFIRSHIHKMDDEYLRSAIDHLQLHPKLRPNIVFPESPNLEIVSWMRLPIYGLDFGWGPPISMGPAMVPFEGQAFLSIAQLNPGLGPDTPGYDQLKLIIALTPAAMDRFRNLIYQF